MSFCCLLYFFHLREIENHIRISTCNPEFLDKPNIQEYALTLLTMYCFVLPSPSLAPLAFLSPIPRQNSGKLKSLWLSSTIFKQVAPLEIHKENLLDVEEQLQFLIHVVEGVTIEHFLPLLKGSFSRWLWHSLGIQVG